MRLSVLDLAQLIVYVLLALAIIFVGARALSVLDGIETRQQQGTLHHEKLMAMADKSLADHTAFQREHQALMDRVLGTERR
jgi:hypothetical protein